MLFSYFGFQNGNFSCFLDTQSYSLYVWSCASFWSFLGSFWLLVTTLIQRENQNRATVTDSFFFFSASFHLSALYPLWQDGLCCKNMLCKGIINEERREIVEDEKRASPIYGEWDEVTMKYDWKKTGYSVDRWRRGRGSDTTRNMIFFSEGTKPKSI